ncbi:MAG: MutS-related protein [Actinomycetota bacterium]
MYQLEPVYCTPQQDEGVVLWRQGVFRDLQSPGLGADLAEFAKAMRTVRNRLHLADELRHELQKQRWFLDAATAYCDAAEGLAGALAQRDLVSPAMRTMRDWLSDYTASATFRTLRSEVDAVCCALSEITYCLRIKGGRVEVSTYQGQDDYSDEVLASFERFKQGPVKDYAGPKYEVAAMNHVEEKIIDLVAALHRDRFDMLHDFTIDHRQFLDPTVANLEREIQFFGAYRAYVDTIASPELTFCLPTVSATSKAISAAGTFDLVLAAKLVRERRSPVPNDIFLTGQERMLVVTGPNQGGKTTLCRAFGQLHYLAALGCPVPGRSAKLFLADQILTHFEREEDLTTLSGKLQDDLVRVRAILAQATPNSIVLLNEIFTSTSLADAVVLGIRVLDKLIELDVLGVCVTFVDEWASLGAATVSMVAAVDPGDPTRRTFKVLRRPADGRSHAMALASKHGLTYEALLDRLAS